MSRRLDSLDPRLTFAGLVVGMLVIAVSHLYALYGISDVWLGVPTWVWLQLIVITFLLGLAWIATDVVSPARGQ